MSKRKKDGSLDGFCPSSTNLMKHSQIPPDGTGVFVFPICEQILRKNKTINLVSAT